MTNIHAYTTFHYLALHYITFTLHYTSIALRCIALHYITYIHIYIYISYAMTYPSVDNIPFFSTQLDHLGGKC